MNERIHIVVCGDHRFVMPMGVLFHSISKNNQDVDVDFHLITDDSLTSDDGNELEAYTNEYRKSNNLYIYKVDADEVRAKMHFKDGFYKIQTFYRLLITDMLPENVDRVIYLDGDIIVRGSLLNLWRMPMDDIAVGAAQDSQEGIVSYFNRLHYPSAKGYFNAGVLLINLHYWRENNLQEQFLDFVSKYPERIVLNDQDILNAICQNCKCEIPLKYNVQSGFLYKDDKCSFDIWKHPKELEEARSNPVVLHYSGDRPWEKGCTHPWKDEWLQYRNETIWKDVALWGNRTPPIYDSLTETAGGSANSVSSTSSATPTIAICACASDNYTMQCGVTFCSVCENNKDAAIRFFVITDEDFKEEHKQQLRELIASYDKKEISFLAADERLVDKFLAFDNYFYTKHVFFRWFMADLLPSDVSRVLYLDCDTIVRKPLRPLWETDMSGYAVGAVHDAQEAKITQFNRLEYSYDKGYFNSGVLLVNLDYWRQNNVAARLFAYLEKHPERVDMPDQDPLNAVLQDEKKYIPFTYNLQSDFLFTVDRMTIDYNKYKEELETCREDPVILHLSGARPWIKGCTHPYQSEFFKYRALTIWKDAPLWKDYAPLKRRLMMSNKVRRPLSHLGLCQVLQDPFNRTLHLKD